MPIPVNDGVLVVPFNPSMHRADRDYPQYVSLTYYSRLIGVETKA